MLRDVLERTAWAVVIVLIFAAAIIGRLADDANWYAR
jgi:hypothetical protein